MRDKQSLHLKIQELCDCYATTDPLKEMSDLPRDKDVQEAALKWLALAVLHGINDNAEKITLNRTDDKRVKVIAEYQKSELPPPGVETGSLILDTVRKITRMEEGEIPLALGIRGGSIEMMLKIIKDSSGESVILEFPGMSRVESDAGCKRPTGTLLSYFSSPLPKSHVPVFSSSLWQLVQVPLARVRKWFSVPPTKCMAWRSLVNGGAAHESREWHMRQSSGTILTSADMSGCLPARVLPAGAAALAFSRILGSVSFFHPARAVVRRPSISISG